MTDVKKLEVCYHDRLVGYLAETPDHMIAFQYSDGWLRDGFSISPLSLPLNNNVFIPPDKCRDRFKGLFGVFADSLPDSWGELLLDRHLETLGINRGDITTLDRLAYVGRSGMGALEYYPSKETDFAADKEQMYRIMCFNVLTYNLDDHAKNFSFLYTNDAGWRLAPAYDLTYSVTYWGEQTTSVCGKGKYISEKDLVKVGTNAGLSKSLCTKILYEIRDKAESLSQYLGNRNYLKVEKTRLADRIAEISIMR